MRQMCLPIHSVQDSLKCRVFTLDIFSAKLLNEWEGDEDTQLLGAYQHPFSHPKIVDHTLSHQLAGGLEDFWKFKFVHGCDSSPLRM